MDGAEVIRFSGEGACLPAATIVQYRCGPAEVPVLRLADERHPTSFLGGPFAVPVETVPANIRSVGRGAGTEVLVADPPEPTPSPTPSGSALPISMPVEPIRSEPLVYVRRDGVTERWLGMERRRGVADPPVLWLVGDSIMDGGRDVLTSSLADWTLTIDAEVGRPSSAGVALAAAAADQEADVVVVELGTNDSSPSDFRDHLVATLDLLREVPLVVWQTARGPEDHAAIGAVNEAIREVVPGYPNVAIADWEAFVPEEALMEDGIHPLDGFESLESDLLTPILAAWRGAVSGDGATSCAGRVLRASD
ncbi:MAG TPA: GDSL-type esterase/lipase family protein [Actinomycetota bacterium]|nr:GDSL-type esterase/lipase family protein [Actinomycetota bacterium]